MAKSLKKLDFEKINWTNTIKNFNRFSKENKLGVLDSIGKEVATGKFQAVGKVDPDYVAPGPHIIVLGNGRIIVIIVFGPKPKPFPGIGPYVRETLETAIKAKDVKFDRFANNGVQHMMVTTSKAKIEIMAMPK